MASKQTMGAAMIIQGMNAPESPVPPTATAWNGVAALPQLGVIRAQGEEAAAFLQSQLTQDMAAIAPGQARLAGLCNAKGRMLASFVACRHAPDEFWLVCSRDLLAATLKKLSMFVLRAKVKLSDATPSHRLLGCIGSDAIAAVPADSGAALLKLPVWGQPGLPERAVAVFPASGANPESYLPPTLDSALWDWMDVHSGVARVGAAVAGQFVPQTLNYESCGGVNFKKGCFPGQEVVARSQFRGAIKRRAYLAHADAELVAGADVYAPADPEQPCGTVVQAAPAPNGGWDAIVSLQIAAAEQGGLHATAVDGTTLTLGTLPYLLLEDI